MRRLLVLATMVLVAGAVPAWAHEEISPNTVPTGRPAFLLLGAANEKRVDLTKLTLTAPSGGEFGDATRDPAGWTSTRTPTTITWTGGAVKPGRFEQFGFEVEEFAQPGTMTYKANLVYADGSTQDANVPVAAVADSSAPGVGTPADGSDDHHAGEATESDTGESRANLALGLSVLAVVAAVAAFAAGRRSASGSPSGSGTKPAPSGSGQDW